MKESVSMAKKTRSRRIFSIVIAFILVVNVFGSVVANAATSDAYAALPYYFVDFEDGYNMTNDARATVVNDGVGESAKCVKLEEAVDHIYGDYLVVKPGPSVVSGVVPAGGTLRISFWVKLGQVMKTDRAGFTFIIGKKEGGYFLESSGEHPYVFADETSTDWQKITYEVTVTELLNIKSIHIRTALGGISNQLPNGSDPSTPGGTRTYYIDDLEILIANSGETGIPSSSGFEVTGTVVQGEKVSFSHIFTPATDGATDKSLVRLVCADDSGNKVSLGATGVGDIFTVPALPYNRKLAFEVVPIDSAGGVGKTATYSIVRGATYLVADFESGEAWNTNGNVYTLVDGPGASKHALSVTDTLPEFDLGIRSRSDYDENGDGKVDGKWKYDVSMWIKADAFVTSDKVELIFKLKNQSTGSGDPAILEETVTISSAGLKTGEWVKVRLSDMIYDGKTKGMYDGKFFDYEKDYATIPDGGTVRVRVSDGIAYSIDDLVIMPERYAPYQEIISASLDDVTSLTSPWSVTDAAGEFNTSYVGTVVGSETVGNAVTITNAHTASSLQYATSPRPPLKFGIDYTVECMVKAENEKAVGLVPTMLALYYNRTDTENLPNNHTQVNYDSRNGTTISTSWQKFKWNFKMDYLTTDTVSMYMAIRLTGIPENVMSAKWSIANIKMYPTEEKFTNLTVTSKLTGELLADGTALADFASSVLTGQVKTCISRIEVPYGNDYVIYKTFDNYKNKKSFLYKEGSLEGARVVSCATDKDDYFGSESIVPATFSFHTLTAVAEFGQTIWAPDMPMLSAKVRYSDATGEEALLALCATYGHNKRLLTCDIKRLTISSGEGEVALAMETHPKSETAKIFLWKEGTYAPRISDVAEIKKTEVGSFIYVDNGKGSNNSEYGYTNPLKNVQQAVDAANTVMKSNPSDIYIILMPGTHPVTQELCITEEMTDSIHKVKFVSYDKHKISTISGGRNLTGTFTHHENGIYKTQIEKDLLLRDLYVNGEKATKARSRELASTEFTNLNVISPHSAGGSYVSETGVGLQTTSSEWFKLKNYKRIQDMEFVFHRLWIADRCQVSGITDNGDGSITLAMDNPAWGTMATGVDMFVETPLYIENAYELLDEPGEWYLDSTDGTLYYMPRENENMATVEVILPIVDNYKQKLINILGTEVERVNNLSFENIEFAHTTWTRPSTTYGHVVLQNNILRDFHNGDTYIGTEHLRLPESAIDVDYASNIEFIGCKFTKLGSNGIRVYTNVATCNIIGNEFYDISSSAICIGDYTKVVNGEIVSLCYGANIENITISNNYIHDVARDYWSAAAVSVSWAKNTTVSNNEICNIPYTGIHVGLGWNYETGANLTDLTVDIENNYIHHLFRGYIYDGGAIYTNGLSGGTKENPNKICGNYITDVGAGGACIYNDNGSTAYLVEHNFMDARNSFSEICRTTGVEKEAARSMNINVQGAYRNHDLVWRKNYSTTRKCMAQPTALIDASNYIDTPTFVGEDSTWNDEIRKIIENAGIQENYKKNFEFGLQMLKVAETVELNVGDSISAVPIFKTSKGVIYKNKSLAVSTNSNNTAVAAVQNNQIVAVGEGSATITYCVVENGIRYQARTNVFVT